MASKPTCARKTAGPVQHNAERTSAVSQRAAPASIRQEVKSQARREGKRRIWREGAGRGEAAALGGDQGPYKENWSEAEVEPGSAKQRQHMKKSYPNQDATKKGRRLGREKQPPSKESTQETDLWDEAIVGSCY